MYDLINWISIVVQKSDTPLSLLYPSHPPYPLILCIFLMSLLFLTFLDMDLERCLLWLFVVSFSNTLLYPLTPSLLSIDVTFCESTQTHYSKDVTTDMSTLIPTQTHIPLDPFRHDSTTTSPPLGFIIPINVPSTTTPIFPL